MWVKIAFFLLALWGTNITSVKRSRLLASAASTLSPTAISEMGLLSPDSSNTVSVPAKQALESDLSFEVDDELMSAVTGVRVGEPGATGLFVVVTTTGVRVGEPGATGLFVVTTTGMTVGEPGATGLFVEGDTGALGVVTTTGLKVGKPVGTGTGVARVHCL